MKDMAKTLYLNNFPKSQRTWEEIGKNMNTAEQCIDELLDNSISNLIVTKSKVKKIEVLIEQISPESETVYITVEDSGTGLKNLEQSMTLFETSEETARNEHGLGWKQALSASNPANDNWEIFERTNDLISNRQYIHIKAPYTMGKLPYKIINESEKEWPGHDWGRTLFKVGCDYRLFQNIVYEQEDALKLHINIYFTQVADLIYENIGLVYADILEKEDIEIKLTYKLYDQPPVSHIVTPLLPVWEDHKYLESFEFKLHCDYGSINKLPARIPFDNTTSDKYYKENMASSGVEIRLNGRLIKSNILTDIYGIKNHPQYNKFISKINIVTENPNELPKTTTMKNGFQIGEKRICSIYDWIKTNIPINNVAVRTTHLPKVTEKQCANKLAARLAQELSSEYTLGGEPVVTREYPLFKKVVKNNPPRADIFVNLPDHDQIIECKRDVAQSRDLYQLMEYCDGYYCNTGKILKDAVLVAACFPEDIKRLANFLNKKNKDLYPEIQLITWNQYEKDFKENLLKENIERKAVNH